MRRTPPGWCDWILTGVVQGIAAWIGYGLAECIFSSVLPNLSGQRTAYSLLHPGFLLSLFLFYITAGALSGALMGALLYPASTKVAILGRSDPRTVLSAAAGSTVVAALVANCVIAGTPHRWTLLGFLLLSVLSITGMAAAAVSPKTSIWLRASFNPWSVTASLVGSLWLLSRADSRLEKAGMSALWIAAIMLASNVIYRLLRALRAKSHVAGSEPSAPLILTGLGVLLGVFLTFSLWANRAPGLVAGNLEGSAARRGSPNVLLITLDTVRADHMSLYGYSRSTTPSLDHLARSATLFTRAVSAGDVTVSSHASILTGTYAQRHGVHFDPPDNTFGRHLPERFVTLAEVLAERGYATAAVTANYAWLGPRFQLNRGFQYHDARRRVTFLHHPDQAFYLRHFLVRVLRGRVPREAFEPRYRRAEAINRDVYSLLNRLSRLEAPFFLFVNYLDPHAPYLPPSPFDQSFEGKDTEIGPEQFGPIQRAVMLEERPISARERAHFVSQYDGEIAYLDAQLGELLKRLDESGLYDNTLIVVTSDHGESFGERQLIEHGVSVYQDQVHVPLIIKYPGQDQPDVVDQLVSHVDIAPTILGATNSPQTEILDGVDLRGNGERKSRAVISESFRNLYFDWTSRLDREERAVYQGTLKLIYSTSGKLELYNLSDDPTETHDLHHEMPEESGRLRSLLEIWQAQIENDPGDEGELSEELDEETRDALRSLGYIQ